jgi:CheY-like chemotaxis protein/anti-sigma regulatory factor (Ser/Thr protein kinase)
MNYLLIVDDSSVEAHVASFLLQTTFHERIKFAQNGWEALELIKEQLPLVVITDLRMPLLDGLQLTERIRRQYPTVPVILMTAYGSEDIAAQALASGAVDFVPKSLLKKELVRAVQNVLAMSSVGLRDLRINRFLRREESEFEFGNDLTLIPPLVLRLRETAQQMGLVDESRGLRLAKALTEALHNAIGHGNLELTAEEWEAVRTAPVDSEIVSRRLDDPRHRNRKILMTARLSPDVGEFTVRDDGPGFDTRTLPDISADPSRLASNERRGLLLMKAFTDELRFNDRGNEVTMIIRRRQPEPAAETSLEGRA